MVLSNLTLLASGPDWAYRSKKDRVGPGPPESVRPKSCTLICTVLYKLFNSLRSVTAQTGQCNCHAVIPTTTGVMEIGREVFRDYHEMFQVLAERVSRSG